MHKLYYCSIVWLETGNQRKRLNRQTERTSKRPDGIRPVYQSDQHIIIFN